jgi:hypothetical protein
MYIGQKKNFWIIDLQAITNYELRITNWKEGMTKLHVDQLKEHISALWDERFVDEMVAEGKETMDALFGEGSYDMYTFDGNYELRITNYEKSKTKLLEPNYMIEANVSN